MIGVGKGRCALDRLGAARANAGAPSRYAAAMARTLVVLTGAGVSADSGLATFRGAGGLWEGRRVEDVATPEAWRADPRTGAHPQATVAMPEDCEKISAGRRSAGCP